MLQHPRMLLIKHERICSRSTRTSQERQVFGMGYGLSHSHSVASAKSVSGRMKG
jgi:hypothetical protein